MTYLTCTKHRSYQRKHIDVCRRCSDKDECDAFQVYAATEPPPLPEPAETNIPIHQFLQELADIRQIVAGTPPLQETKPAALQMKPLHGLELIEYIRSELAGIRKLC